MSSNAPKTLFYDSGLLGDGSVCLTLGAPAERHLEKVSSFMSKAVDHERVKQPNDMYWQVYPCSPNMFLLYCSKVDLILTLVICNMGQGQAAQDFARSFSIF